jgi:ABC-type multidrug transport system fused ATPase/permease subunit
MFQRVLRATTTFFDLNTVGAIVSRFAKDLDTTDVVMSELMPTLVLNIVWTLTSGAFMCFAAPYLAPLLVVVAALFFFLTKHYLTTNTSLRRLEALNREPMINVMGELVSGLPVLRSYGCLHEMTREHTAGYALSARSVYNGRGVQRWFSVRFEAINSVIVLFMALLSCALIVSYSPSERTSKIATISLGLVYSVKLGSTLATLIGLAIDIEAQITGVQRVAEFCEKPPQEVSCRTAQETAVAADWPTGGEIRFENAKLRYREDLPLALRGVTFTIKAGEHIGVVGRTGSGKSTIMQALFRLVELSEGDVCIDGVAIRSVDINHLRSRLTIIPQDPMLFKGTVRSNLDPCGVCADSKLQAALDAIGLSARLQLDTRVTENGECFSVGQRQLLCLARAMARDCRVVVLDEATANVDAATDQVMQGIIRRAFASCTTITIAHRIDTILDSDRILVLDYGTVLEFAPPAELLANASSSFYQLVHAHQSSNV